MSSAQSKIEVSRHESGAMLVEVLAAPGRGRDWREANELVRGSRVQVNGNVVTDGARQVRAGDVVKILPHPQAKAAGREDVRIVHADEHLVVVDKPPAVTSVRGAPDPPPAGTGRGRRRGRQATLEEMVASLLGSREGSGGSRGRTGMRPAARRGAGGAVVLPVHRLDRDTSGLMLFARTAEAQRRLEAMFKAREIERSYLAVVHGHPPAVTLTSHILRDRGDGLRGSAEAWGREPAGGERSVTHVEPVEAIGPYAVVRCRLETGRTHQIRIHLSEAGHMLCGERQYTRRPDGTRLRDDSAAPRQALHAERLAFVHPARGREMGFSARLPPDLADWLAGLRRRF